MTKKSKRMKEVAKDVMNAANKAGWGVLGLDFGHWPGASPPMKLTMVMVPINSADGLNDEGKSKLKKKK